jgi:hypothetical protein
VQQADDDDRDRAAISCPRYVMRQHRCSTAQSRRDRLMSGDDLATSLTLKPTARYNGFIQTSGNLDIIGMEVEGTLVVKLSPVMTHPVRTLLNEVFVLPPKRILLRAYEVCVRTTRFMAAAVIHFRRHLRPLHPAFLSHATRSTLGLQQT